MSSPIQYKRKIDACESIKYPAPKIQCGKELTGFTIILSSDRVLTLTSEQKKHLIANSNFFSSACELSFLENSFDLSDIDTRLSDRLGDKDAVKNFIQLLSREIKFNNLGEAREFLNISEDLRGYFVTDVIDQYAKIYLLANGCMKDLSKVLKLSNFKLTAFETETIMERVLPCNQTSYIDDIPNEEKLVSTLAIKLENKLLSKPMRWIMEQFKNRTHVNLKYITDEVCTDQYTNIFKSMPKLKSINFYREFTQETDKDGYDEGSKGLAKIIQAMKGYPFESLSFRKAPYIDDDVSKALQDLPELKELGLYDRPIYDLEELPPLQRCKNLKKIHLYTRDQEGPLPATYTDTDAWDHPESMLERTQTDSDDGFLPVGGWGDQEDE